MSNIPSNTTGTNYSHYEDEYDSYLTDATGTLATPDEYNSYITDALATPDESKHAYKIATQSWPSALNEGLKDIVEYISDAPIVTPVTLADWRGYVNDPENQNTHATISGSSVVAAPDTWHGHVITFLFRMSQEDVAKNFRQAVAGTVQNDKITQFVFNAALEEKAKTSQPAILLQKALNAAIAAAVPVLNAQLKTITLAATPEGQPSGTASPTAPQPEGSLTPNSSGVTSSATSIPSSPVGSTSPAASKNSFSFFQTNLQETIIKSIQESLANSIVDTAVDGGVSHAVDQLNGMKISMQFDPNATIELTSGKENSMVNDVLTCFQQTLNAGIKAAIPVVNAWGKVQISLTLPDSDKAPTPLLPKNQPQNATAATAASSELQQPEAVTTGSTPLAPKPLMQYCVEFPQTLQETIVEALDKTVVGQITNEAVDRGITRALKQLSGATIGVQIDPNTKAPIGGVTHELVKEVIDTTDTLIGKNLNRVAEAAKAIRILSDLLHGTENPPSAETTEAAAQALQEYVSTIHYSEHAISQESKEALNNDPLTLLLKTINQESSTIARARTKNDNVYLSRIEGDGPTLAAMRGAARTTAEISHLITQSLLPREAMRGDTPDLPIEKLEESLAPLLKQLEGHLELLKQGALRVDPPSIVETPIVKPPVVKAPIVHTPISDDWEAVAIDTKE